MTGAELTPTSRETAAHYIWGVVSEGWRLVDGPDLSVIEERVPPDSGEQWHVHDTARQFFYVLEGRAHLHTARGIVEMSVAEGVEVPAGTAHRFANPGPADVRFLVVSAPSTRGDRRAVDAP
ncbi:cupin domain-containing protein [Microbacterium sp. BG28]|uniref:cupin domain-containing protein n=1 Tax=Microbacterium sp. BG28 TaxID=3097356 RepID=UPI002A5AD47E|nr:cupin domain-containing protein [Microbacterium sp. BG28]MDY0828769.1 cupin domain-containing protein [Microbacterium sp. BG28]